MSEKEKIAITEATEKVNKKELSLDDALKLTKKFPKSHRAHVVLANVYIQKGENEKCLKQIKKSLKLGKSNPAYNISASCKIKLGLYDDAKKDFLDALNWCNNIGGLSKLLKRSKNNLNIIKDWVSSSNWAGFLSEDKHNISNTSICLKLIDPFLVKLPLEVKKDIEKNIIKLLEIEKVAFDIGSYRSAPPGLRIWGGPTVENEDIKKLLPWLDWAYHKSINNLKDK